MSSFATRTTLPITAALAALAVAAGGCGGSSGGAGAGQRAIGGGRAAAPATPSVSLGHAVVTTNNAQAAPKKGALDRLANSPASGEPSGKPNGRESLIAGTPDTGILAQLPQPEGLGAATKVCAAASAAPSGGNVAQVSRAVLCLLNAQRTSRHLKPLKNNKKLARAAIAHAKNMVAKHYFAHEGPDGNPLSRIKKAGYIPRIGLWTVGENLAFGTGTSAEAGQIMTAWMNSPEHKANILTAAFREIGIGIVAAPPTGGGAGATFATDFGGIRTH
jgi:uncharacterized protein YkwD